MISISVEEYQAMQLPAKVKHRRHPESDSQRAVITWARLFVRQYPELAVLFAVGNGGKRNGIEAAIMNGEGVLPGIPDLCLPIARGEYGCLFIEMKAGKNKVTEIQANVIERLEYFGNCVKVCYSSSEAIKVLQWYLNLTTGE